MLTGLRQIGQSQVAEDEQVELWVDDTRRALGVVLGVMVASASSGTVMLVFGAIQVKRGVGAEFRMGGSSGPGHMSTL